MREAQTNQLHMEYTEKAVRAFLKFLYVGGLDEDSFESVVVFLEFVEMIDFYDVKSAFTQAWDKAPEIQELILSMVLDSQSTASVAAIATILWCFDALADSSSREPLGQVLDSLIAEISFQDVADVLRASKCTAIACLCGRAKLTWGDNVFLWLCHAR